MVLCAYDNLIALHIHHLAHKYFRSKLSDALNINKRKCTTYNVQIELSMSTIFATINCLPRLNFNDSLHLKNAFVLLREIEIFPTIYRTHFLRRWNAWQFIICNETKKNNQFNEYQFHSKLEKIIRIFSPFFIFEKSL